MSPRRGHDQRKIESPSLRVASVLLQRAAAGLFQQAEASEPQSQAGTAAAVPLHCRGAVATWAIGRNCQIIIMIMTCAWTQT